MEDLTSLNEWISDHENGELSFLTAQPVDNGLSPSPVQPTGLSLSPELAP